jgi:ribosome-associated protein
VSRTQPLPHRHKTTEIYMSLRITETIELADWELSESFMRASGPGGQNVNKVSSAVELRFEAERSPNLPPAVKIRLRKLAGRRWTKDGAIILQCDETRSQVRNRELIRERLVALIKQATERPKFRVKTKPTKGSVRRRLDGKKKRGEVKALRGRVE